MNISLPPIDLSEVMPVAGLILVVVLIGVFLLVRTLLNSRVALLIAVVIGVMAAGPALANAAAAIVGAIVPLGIVLVAGFIGSLFLLNRNPELMSLVRDMLHRPQTLSRGDTIHLRADVVDQQPKRLTAPITRQQISAPRSADRRDSDTWGGLR
jgi:hypothetical protein